MSFLRKRGKKWYLCYRQDGKPQGIPISTDRQTANEYKARFDYDATRKRLSLPGRKMAWIDFKAAYLSYSKTNKSYKTHLIDQYALKSYEKALFPQTISDVTFQSMERWKKARSNEVSPTSVNIELRAIKAAISYANQSGMLPDNQIRIVRPLVIDKRLPRFLKPDEIPAFLKVADASTADRAGLLARVFIYAGLRLQEALHLRWEDINLDMGWLYVRGWGTYKPKDREERQIPVHNTLREAFQTHRNESGLVFGMNGGVRDGGAVTRLFNKFYRRAGIKASGIHVLRHTFGSLMTMKGVPSRTLQKWMGHSSAVTTLIYQHLTDEHSQEMMKRVSNG